VLAASIAFSAHIGLSGSFNAAHPALWLERDQWKAGAYLNSNEEISVFAARRFGGDAWIEAGVVSGYSVPVMLRAGVQVGKRAALWIAPAVKADGNRGAVVGVEFRLF